MSETKPNIPAEILYHFIEGQLELEPEHYPYTVAQITALETKVKANTAADRCRIGNTAGSALDLHGTVRVQRSRAGKSAFSAFTLTEYK